MEFSVVMISVAACYLHEINCKKIAVKCVRNGFAPILLGNH